MNTRAGRARLRLSRRGPYWAAAAVVVTAMTAVTTGCSVAEDAARSQVDQATERAGEAVASEVEQQAQSALDGALAEVDSTCSQLLVATGAEQTSILTGVLQAFWLAELAADAAPQAVVESYTAAVVAGCEASGESRVADVARATYDGGQFAPPQG